jgi:hypothetical protein
VLGEIGDRHGDVQVRLRVGVAACLRPEDAHLPQALAELGLHGGTISPRQRGDFGRESRHQPQVYNDEPARATTLSWGEAQKGNATRAEKSEFSGSSTNSVLVSRKSYQKCTAVGGARL